VQKFVQASLPDLDKEIIAGDNYSIDGTAAVELFGQQQPAVVTNISFINKIRGEGAAIRTGMQAAAAGSSAAYVYWLRSAGKYLYFGKNSRILEYLSALFAAQLLLPCLRLLAEWAKCPIRKITRIILTAEGLNTRGRQTALSFVLSRRCLDFQSEVPVYLFTPSKDALLLWLNGHTVDHFGGSTVWT
jgi:hypothetical protein